MDPHDMADAPPTHTGELTRLERLRITLKPLTFAIFAGSMILDVFNVTGLTFAQASIAEHFDVDENLASWSLSAYALTFGSFLLLSGRAGMITPIN
jgi:MFS family permease